MAPSTGVSRCASEPAAALTAPLDSDGTSRDPSNASGGGQRARQPTRGSIGSSRLATDYGQLLRSATMPQDEPVRREPAAQTAPVLAIGVDGCPTGWFFVELQPSGITRSGVVRTLHELVRDAREPARLYVDMPIGLPEGPGGRECDHLARRELGPRGSSVFPAPARAVLDAVDYESAKRHSLRTMGRSLSKQAWAIVPKCREVDRLLRDDAKARRIVREVHPELCFWALAGGRPMQHSKKHEPGIQERIAVLRQMHPSAAAQAGAMVERRPRSVARDDVVDAMAAAVTAAADDAAIRTLPPRPPRDACGLPMEMVYVHCDSVIHNPKNSRTGTT